MIKISARRGASFFTVTGLTDEIDIILRGMKYVGEHHINAIPLIYRDVLKRFAEAIPRDVLRYDD